MLRTLKTIRPIPDIALPLIILAALILTSFYSYLLFHTLAELFSILIAGTIFILAWNFRRFYDDHFLLFIGISCLFFSFIDVIHTMSYKGMGVFQGYDANLPTQLWVAARYMQSISLLAAPLFIRRKANVAGLLAGYTLVTGLLLLSIFAWKIFPVCYIEGSGLTLFKKVSEYIIDLILVAAIIFLLRNRQALDRWVLRLLILSIGCTMIAELAFTFYVDVYGLSNLAGHIFKIIASFLIYKAIIETAVRSIYTDMTTLQRTERELRESEARYQALASATVEGILFSENGRILDANEQLIQMLGYTPEEIVGQEISMIIVPEDSGRVMENVLAQRESSLEVGLLRKDGARLAVEARARMISYQNRRVRVAAIHDITERKRLEDERRKLSLAVEQSPDTVVITDTHGSIEYVNPKFTELTGYTLEDARGKTPSILKSGHTSREEYARLWETITAGQIWRGEFLNKKHNGELYWEYASITPVHNEDGEITHYLAVKEDITERKAAEEALRESEERFIDFIESTHDGFLALDRDFCIIYANRRAGELNDVDPKALIGQVLWEQWPRLRGSEVEKYYRKVMEERAPVHFQSEGLYTSRWYVTSIYPTRDGVSVFFTDRTQEHKAQEALRQSENHLRRLFDMSIVGIVSRKPDGAILNTNDAFLNMMGYTRDAFEAEVGNIHDVIPEDYQPLEQSMMEEVLREGTCGPREKEYLRKDGSRLPVLVGHILLEEPQVEITSFVVDLADLKAAEAALVEYAEKLKRSNQDLEQFAFVASHDLQEPLRKIKSFSELLARKLHGGLDETAEDYLNRMQNAADRMQAMIHDLLELSRIATRGKEFELVKLDEVIEDVISDLEPRIQKERGQVETGNLPCIEADPLQMRQLFLNLVGNALKYHKAETPPRVLIYCQEDRSRNGKAGTLTILVEDNGIGFEEQYVERIFQPFTRLHGRGEYEGNGIGLAICAKIVERHHGKITARSRPGEGSTFMITLPTQQCG